MAMFGFDDRFVLYDVTPVENQFILTCLPTANAAQLRVYLYGLLQCRHPAADMSVDRMAHDLNLTVDEVMAAFRHWEFHRLVERVSDNPPAFRFVSLSERTAMGTDAPSDPEYMRFAESLSNCFGDRRRLHGAESTMAFEWVEVMGLPTDVVLVMVRDLIRTHGLHFSFSTTGQKTAARLADAQVKTVEDALAVLATDEKVEKGTRAVLRRLGKRGRTPTEDEMSLYRKWITEWGFTQEAVEEACAATVNADTPTMGYLDGVLRRIHQSGASAATGTDMSAYQQRQGDAEQALKDVFAVLRTREVVNQGTLEVYAQMRQLYPDEAILRIAAEECARVSGKLEDMQRLVESWHQRGLRNEAEIRAYLTQIQGQNQTIRQIYTAWGQPRHGVTKTDRERLQRWQGEYGYSAEILLACADYAADAEKPMAYLNSLMETYHQMRLNTLEEIRAERAVRHHRPGEGQKLKVLPAQQYEQRDYTGADAMEMPDWLLKRWKETYGDAKQDS